jgi:predicted transcriptional regulator
MQPSRRVTAKLYCWNQNRFKDSKHNWDKSDRNLIEQQENDILRSGKRDKLELTAAIVAVALKPSTSTRIVQHTKTNNSTIKGYLKFMIEKHLLTKKSIAKASRKIRFFEATERGITFLKTYCDILKLLYGENFIKNTNDLAVACLQLSEEP